MVRHVLRIGAYQLLLLDRIPSFAAVHQAVELTKAVAGPGAARFVNALLRRLTGAFSPSLPPDAEAALAIRMSHPLWLVERWRARYGLAEAEALCRANQQIPPVGLRVNTLRASATTLRECATTAGAQVEESPWLPEFLRLSGGMEFLEKSAPEAGEFLVMDEAAGLVVELLAPKPGERILDACAGGGNKSALLAIRTGDRAAIVALDPGVQARRRLETATRRLGLVGIQPRAGDARRLDPDLVGWADSVLVDAPCTGIGTLRRRPEIKWRVEPADITRLSALQGAILAGAAKALRPGGVLVYAVCSTEPEEGDEVVRHFLAREPEFRLEPPPGFPAQARELVGQEGILRTRPDRHGIDGFFAARLRRR